MSGLVRLVGRRFIADPVPVANTDSRIVRPAATGAADCPATNGRNCQARLLRSTPVTTTTLQDVAQAAAR